MNKEYERFKERKRQRKNVWKFVNSFGGSFEHGTRVSISIFGFMVSQLFWIWLLSGFIGFLYNYLNELSEFTLGDQVTRSSFIGIFWLIYFLWFVVTLVIRFRYTIEIEEEKK